MEHTIKEFNENIQKYIDSYDDSFYENKLKNLREQVSFDNFKSLYRFSSSFTDFMKKVNFKDATSLNLLDNISRLYSPNPDLMKLRGPCFKSILKFKMLLKNNNILNNIFIREFVISLSVLVLYTPYGEVKNLELFESIQFLWIIIDNITDNEDMKDKKKILKPIFSFLKNKIYEKDNVKEFLYKYRNDICISIIADIYKNNLLANKKEFFGNARKLFMYSYTKKGLKEEIKPKQEFSEFLEVSINKAYLTHHLFKYCFTEDMNEDSKLYYHCIMVQLTDDLFDMSDDIINKGNTIFTSQTRKNRSIIAICLIETMIKKFPELKKYLIMGYINSILYNKHLHDPIFIKELVKYDFINIKKCDFRELEDIIFKDRIEDIIDDKLIEIIKNSFVPLKEEQVLLKIEAISEL